MIVRLAGKKCCSPSSEVTASAAASMLAKPARSAGVVPVVREVITPRSRAVPRHCSHLLIRQAIICKGRRVVTLTHERQDGSIKLIWPIHFYFRPHCAKALGSAAILQHSPCGEVPANPATERSALPSIELLPRKLSFHLPGIIPLYSLPACLISRWH